MLLVGAMHDDEISCSFLRRVLRRLDRSEWDEAAATDTTAAEGAVRYPPADRRARQAERQAGLRNRQERPRGAHISAGVRRCGSGAERVRRPLERVSCLEQGAADRNI